MLRPDFSKWNQTADDLLSLAREAKHPRSRERYLALYAIGSGQSNATQWAKATGRENETVMGWIHRYNAHGAEAIAYRHSGGCPPFLAKRYKQKSWLSSKPARPTSMGYQDVGGRSRSCNAG